MANTATATATSNARGIGVVGLLGVLFVALKLTGVINWSWWWVTAPFWGSLLLGLIVFAVVLVVAWFIYKRQ